MTTAESIFSVSRFAFPYLYKFPGQASDERILFITREHESVLFLRQAVVLLAAALIFLMGIFVEQLLTSLVGSSLGFSIELLAALAAIIFGVLGFWWVTTLWKKSVAVITNKRLTKFIYTTPWNRHNLSLPLDMIVDTGAYSKGFVQAFLGLGTFTARSSASSSGVATDDTQRINKKYFYIENVRRAEDIGNYLNKVLFAFRQDWKSLENFRPFLTELKGEERKEFMKRFPEYWS